MDFPLYCQKVIWGGTVFFAEFCLLLKKPNTPEYAKVKVLTWAKLNSVTALLSPRPNIRGPQSWCWWCLNAVQIQISRTVKITYKQAKTRPKWSRRVSVPEISGTVRSFFFLLPDGANKKFLRGHFYIFVAFWRFCLGLKFWFLDFHQENFLVTQILKFPTVQQNLYWQIKQHFVKKNLEIM